MTRHLLQIIIFTVSITAVMVATLVPVTARAQTTPDTSRRPSSSDSLHYPIHDRRGDQLSSFNGSPFNLRNPSNFKDSIEYDPKTNLYFVVEKIGNKYYRTPTAYTYEEYMKLSSKKSEDNYFRQRADMVSTLNRRLQQPKLNGPPRPTATPFTGEEVTGTVVGTLVVAMTGTPGRSWRTTCPI